MRIPCAFARRALLGLSLVSVGAPTALGTAPAVPPPLPRARPRPSAPNAGLPRLFDLHAVRLLTLDQADEGYPVRVRGVVTHYNPLAHVDLYISQGDVGQYISFAFTQRVRQVFHPGDELEVEGFTVRGGYAPDVMPTAIRVLGRAPLPRPKRLPYPELATGRSNCQRIEISGVVQGAARAATQNQTVLALEVAVPGGVVFVQAWDYRAEDLERFVDTRIRAVGVCGAARTASGQFQAVLLRAGSTRDLVIEEGALDVFATPPQPIDTVLQYSAHGTSDHRVHVQGVITARQSARVLYIQDATSGMRIETSPEAADLRVGDSVEVAGFAAPTATKPILRNAVIRKTGATGTPEPVDLAGTNVLSEAHDAELVRARGKLLGVVTDSAEHALVVQMGDTVFNVFTPVNAASERLKSYQAGSEIAITGVYVFRAEPPQSFRIVLRRPEDVLLLKAAPWWTARHTAVLLVVAVAVGLAVRRTATSRMRRSLESLERQRAVERDRARIARDIHDDLGAGLTQISLLSELVSGDGPEEARAHVAQIAETARELTHAMDEIVWAVKPTGDTLASLWNYLSHFAQDHLAAADIHCRVASPEPLPALAVPAEVRHNVFLAAKEALHNAVKHSGAGEVRLRLQAGERWFQIEIEDDGRGLPGASVAAGARPFSGQGLRNVSERMSAIGGTCEVSAAGPGTRVRLKVAFA